MNFLIRFYQLFVSPLLGCNCRYLPTCSHYARDALALHGPLRGSLLAAARLLRCHPFAPHGLDPVPARFRLFEGQQARVSPARASGGAQQARTGSEKALQPAPGQTATV